MAPALNAPAPNIPYFTPAQIPAAGTAVNPQSDGKPIPKLFQPLKIRGVEFQNRIWVRIVSLSLIRLVNQYNDAFLYSSFLLSANILPRTVFPPHGTWHTVRDSHHPVRNNID